MAGYALGIGYRHIDTAQSYGNEEQIGDAIRESSVPRQEIWLTTKVQQDRLRDGDLQGSVEESVRKLRTEPDLLLLHFPNSKIPLQETIGALNDVKCKGLTNHIGVSNFPVALIQQGLSLTSAPLIVNQVEYHPYLSQWTVLETLHANEMAMTAYSPLAKGNVFRDVTLQNILAVFDFELSSREMEMISAGTSPHGRLVDYVRTGPAWDDLDTVGIARRYIRCAVRAVTRRVKGLTRRGAP
jgi:diketogulonate reductase-like aldo/keto reductase